MTTADVVTAGNGCVGVVRGMSPSWIGASLAGPAFTVRGKAGDNLALHRGLAAAAAGAVIVAVLDGDEPAGHWGELMTIAARTAGIVGVIITGTIRDLSQIVDLEFPVFFQGTAPNPASKEYAGELNQEVSVHGVSVYPDDLVVADADGIAVVPGGCITSVLGEVRALQSRERALSRLIADGCSTLEALNIERA